jgi:hypothetical protein
MQIDHGLCARVDGLHFVASLYLCRAAQRKHTGARQVMRTIGQGCVRQSGLARASLAQTAEIFAERPAPTLTAIVLHSKFFSLHARKRGLCGEAPHGEYLSLLSRGGFTAKAAECAQQFQMRSKKRSWQSTFMNAAQ